MKILIISQYAGAPEMGMVLRNHNWASEFIRLGHQCTIIAASYSHYRQKNKNIVGKKLEEENIDKITYYWLKTLSYDGKNNILRLFSIFQFQSRLSLFLKKLQTDYDLVVVSSPHPFQIYPAHKFCKKCKAKLIFDIRDLWPLTLQKIGKLAAYHPLIILLKYAEKYALQNADLVTAVPQNSKKYLVNNGMNPSCFLAIGNSFNERILYDYSPLKKTIKEYLTNLKKKGFNLIGYCGSLGLANSMDTAIESISRTRNEKINLIICGEGSKKEELKLLAKRLNIKKRVHFLEFIPHNQIASFLSFMDVCYAGGLKSTLYDHGASLTKINDYMASEKPIIYALGDPKNTVEKSGCGICCEPENVKEIARAMDRMASMDNNQLRLMGKKGKPWILKYQTIQSQIKLILDSL